jgi:general L-amino acid transport system permease protein
MAQAEFDTPVWVNRSHPQPAQRPPASEIGTIGWLRANLFNGVWNTLLTLLTLLLVYYAGSSLLRWAFTQAFWEPIWLNRKLFAVGLYPQARLLQPSLVLATVSLLFGLSAGRWGSIVRRVAVGLAALLLLLAVIPIGPAAQIWMGISLALLIAGYVVALRIAIPSSVLAVAWVLSIPFALFVLRGSIELRTVGLSIPILGGPIPSNFIGGLMLTILLTVVGISFSFPIGVALALGRRSHLPVIRYFCIGYIELIRGVPLITLLFMGMLVLPLFLPRGWPSPEAITRVMVAITLFSAAYLAENVRGGLQAVPRGQYEAADAIGLSAWQKTRLIVLPQALRAVIPAIVGQFIALFKDTSLVALVGLTDLLGIGRAVIQQPEWLVVAGGITREVYVFVALVYFVFSFGMSWASRQLEAQLGVGDR